MTGDALAETGYKSIPVGLVTSIHDALCSQREPHGSCDPLDLDHTAYDAAAAVLASDWLAAVRDEAAREAGARIAVAMSGVGGHRDPCRLPDTPCLCGVIDFRVEARAAALRAAPPADAPREGNA